MSTITVNSMIPITLQGTFPFFIPQGCFYFKVTTEKDKNHKSGQSEVGNSGMIPYIDISEYHNPGKIFEAYLKFLPSSDPGAFLFTMPRQISKSFKLLDPASSVLYQKQKSGRHNLKEMLPELCEAAGVPRCTNHQGILKKKMKNSSKN